MKNNWIEIEKGLPDIGNQCEVELKSTKLITIATFVKHFGEYMFRGKDMYISLQCISKWRLAPMKEE